MYLKKLEIYGFKSFADKVELEFNGGIAAVVGPNGCGKSNIADAIRWVLGEQSIKNLRGNKMEDVIFAGTSTRKALGVASVIITFDNSDGTLPIDYEEVAIGRKLYRSGESEYTINGTPCRLKDINDLLYDTGIGKDGYSIIGQGQVEKLINSRPEDRREIFDEATGISKYKYKKMETLKRLEETADNLQRIKDIIREVEAQRSVLREQADKAYKYIELSEKLKILEINGILNQLDEIDEDIKSYIEKEAILQRKIEDIENQKNRYKLENEEKQEKYRFFKENAEELRQKLVAIEKNIEKIEGQYNVIIERLVNRKKDMDSYTKEIEKTEKNIANLKFRLNECLLRIKQKELFLKKIDKYQQDLELKIANLKNVLEEENIANNSQNVYVRVGYLNELLKKDREQLDNINKDMRDIASSLDKKRNAYDAEKNRGDSILSELNKIDEKLKQNLLKLDELKASLESYRSDYQKINAEIDRLTIRLSSMKDIGAENGITRSVKALIDAKNKNTDLPDFWPVINLIDVPEAYQVAIEVALGSALQNVVVKTDDEARILIEYLKENNFGRVTFIPLNTIKDVKFVYETFLYGEKGFIDYAIKLIKYDIKFDKAIRYLFDRIIVCDSIDNALKVSRKYPHRYRIVTLDGEIIYPAGLITGGSLNKNKMFYGNYEEQRLLKEKLISYQKRCEELKNQINLNECEIENMRREIGMLKGQKDEHEKALQEIDINCKKLWLDIEFLEGKLREAQREKNTIMDEIERLTAQIQAYTQESEKSTKEWEEYKETFEELRKKLFKIEVIKAKYQEQLSSFRRQKEEYYSALNQRDDELSKFKSAYRTILSEIADLEEERKQLLQKKHEWFEEKERIVSSMGDVEARLGVFEKEMENIADNLKALEAQLKEVLDQKMQCELNRTKRELRKSDLIKGLDDYYNISREEAEQFRRNINVNADEIRNLKKEIELLGDVNKGAIEEYKKVDERYAFLDTQRKDLEESLLKVQKVIDELDEAMKEQFIKQFGQIGKNFDMILKELFGGGKGKLALVDPSDVLHSGINIEVQLPGKRIQNMQLLSGGEKALCAISLLFAFLYANPSPFCVLDEIDAALDEANVERFAVFLQRLSKKIQFIVITHRRGTMMVADYVYGVSMPEQGVSRLISVKIDEEAS
ncbi:condensin subunit Smc [Caldanaerobius fijiensis DSM 17918]|uniref:Chromosome partition protein Smc n=1 Tax=Caldanaerobius fijiensis DSM 17918 TaxID=1121256 RepID=A0A1M5E6U1_9THEO|nr:chromosome segregation protein SMC [Caldanaerobius fijiensis]SHF74854.1 condensin subunit Smc [Caldanaerobius fijiensis DSM 17918]